MPYHSFIYNLIMLHGKDWLKVPKPLHHLRWQWTDTFFLSFFFVIFIKNLKSLWPDLKQHSIKNNKKTQNVFIHLPSVVFFSVVAVTLVPAPVTLFVGYLTTNLKNWAVCLINLPVALQCFCLAQKTALPAKCVMFPSSDMHSTKGAITRKLSE